MVFYDFLSKIEYNFAIEVFIHIVKLEIQLVVKFVESGFECPKSLQVKGGKIWFVVAFKFPLSVDYCKMVYGFAMLRVFIH